MAIVYKDRSRRPGCVELHNGDHMTQPAFHRVYEQMPDGFKAELIGGTVFVCEPAGQVHGQWDVTVASVLNAYRASTPGLQICGNATVILGKEDEVQPDVFLRILPGYGGRSGNKGLYVKGAPELVVEVSYTSVSIDLHAKKERYARAGVIEYIVLCLNPTRLYWFDLHKGCSLKPNSEGIFCSRVFPGLWIDNAALLRDEYHPLMDALNRGLASAEHADFVAKLAAARG